MRNRYAAGALALSAGLSVYTVYALPRGGVAHSWATSEARWSFPRLGRETAPLPSKPAPSAAAPLPSFSLPPARFASGPAASAAVSLSAAQAAQAAGSFFAKRPAPLVARAPQPVSRPDMASLIVAGRGDDRVVDLAGGAGDVGPASAGGSLEGFRWQQGPVVRDDLPPTR